MMCKKVKVRKYQIILFIIISLNEINLLRNLIKYMNKSYKENFLSNPCYLIFAGDEKNG